MTEEHERQEFNPALVQMEVTGGRRVMDRIEYALKDHLAACQVAGMPLPDGGQALHNLLSFRFYLPRDGEDDRSERYRNGAARITRRQSYYSRRDLQDILRNPQEETEGLVTYQAYHGRTGELLCSGVACVMAKPFDFDKQPETPGPKLVPYLRMLDPAFGMNPQPTSRNARFSRGAHRDIVQSAVGTMYNVSAASLSFAMSEPGVTKHAERAIAAIGVCGVCETQGRLRAMQDPYDAKIDKRHDIYKADMKCMSCDAEGGGYVFIASPDYQPKRGDYRDNIMWMPVPRAGWASDGIGAPTAMSVEAALRELQQFGENPLHKPRVDWAPVFDDGEAVSRQDAANYDVDEDEDEGEERSRPTPTSFKQLSPGWRDVLPRVMRQTMRFGGNPDVVLEALLTIKPMDLQNLAERIAPGQALVTRSYRAAPSWRERPALAMNRTQTSQFLDDLRAAVMKHRPDFLAVPVDDEGIVTFGLKLLRTYPGMEGYLGDAPGCRVLQELKPAHLAMLEAAKPITRALDEDGDIRTEYRLEELAWWMANPTQVQQYSALQRGPSLAREVSTWRDVLDDEIFPEVSERFNRDWMSPKHNLEQDHVDMLLAWGSGMKAEAVFMREHGMRRERVESRGLRSYGTTYRVLRQIPHPDDEMPADLAAIPGYEALWQRDLKQSQYIIDMLPPAVEALFLVVEGHSEYDAWQRGCPRSLRYVAAVPSLDRNGERTQRRDGSGPTGAWELFMHRGWWNIEGE